MATQLSALQRVQRAHVSLMNHPDHCFLAGIVMMGSTSVDNSVPTACTNGRDKIYGEAFVNKQSDETLRGLILHENYHCAFRHLTTWEDLHKKNPKLANQACDYVINIMIRDSDPTGKFVKLPEGGLVDAKYRGMDAGTVFRLLEQEQDDEGDKPGEGGEGFDDHDWKGAQELTKAEKEQLAKDVDQALRQGGMLAGRLGGKMSRELTEALECKVDWREVLRDFISSYCADKDVSTWRKPNRRWVDQDVYLPSLIGEAIGRIVLGIDMSGSTYISPEIIGQFLGNVKHICESVRPDGIDLLYWDTEVCSHEKYDADQLGGLMTSTKPKGGGGTNPQCISDYIKDTKLTPECILVLTDGHVGSWGTGWNAPVFWGITTKGITAKVGVSVYVGD